MTISPSDPAAQLALKIRDLERRLANLETARNAQHTSIADDDGNLLLSLSSRGLQMFDSDGDVRAIVGQFDDDTDRHGVAIYDAGGDDIRFLADNDGMHAPYLTVPCLEVDVDYRIVTDGTFAATHRSQFEIISHLGLYCWVVLGTDAGTTAEVRLRNVGTGATTQAAAIGAGVSVNTQFRWLHGSELGTGPIQFEVQVRRTGGAGNVYAHRPQGMTLVSPSLCVADGIA